MEDTWVGRDLPVLRAIVQIHEDTGRTNIGTYDIQRISGLNDEAIQRAIRALYTATANPFLGEPIQAWSGDIQAVGPPTERALRVAGQWPTPESIVEKLITAFQTAADDDDLAEPERTRARRVVDALKSGGSKIAIAALGSAGGHLLSG